MGDNQEPDNGRRDLIKKGAVIGALAWVAPTIVSVPAASAATAPGTFTLGQVEEQGLHDEWLAVMIADVNTGYTNNTAAPQTVTPDLFSFTAGLDAPVLGAEVQPFVAVYAVGNLLAIGTTQVGPFTPGDTYTFGFGGAPFVLPPGESIVLGARTIGTSGGTPVAYTPTGSTYLTGGPSIADSGTLPGLGVPPTEGATPFTTFYDPRTYQIHATFTVV